MKKIWILIILICLTGCQPNNENDNERNNQMNQKKNSLVLYFSATGTTSNIAKIISEETNSDIIEIIPQEKYTQEDLDYNNDNCRANKEQNNPEARPKIQNDIDVNDYDTIYLGYPIWWGTIPKIILSLLDNYNLNSKTIIPFCTSGSTDITQSLIDLKTYNKEIDWQDGKRFSSTSSKNEIIAWLNNININNQSNDIYIKINNKILTATLEDNSSAQAFIEKLKEGDLILQMNDYGNFEKVGKLNFSLPTNNHEITTEPGDIILYQGNSITIYYDTNTWNFTKLGKIKDINQSELKKLLGDTNVEVTFSLKK